MTCWPAHPYDRLIALIFGKRRYQLYYIKPFHTLNRRVYAHRTRRPTSFLQLIDLVIINQRTELDTLNRAVVLYDMCKPHEVAQTSKSIGHIEHESIRQGLKNHQPIVLGEGEVVNPVPLHWQDKPFVIVRFTWDCCQWWHGRDCW